MTPEGLPEATPKANELDTVQVMFESDIQALMVQIEQLKAVWSSASRDNAGLQGMATQWEPIAEECRNLIKQADHLYKLMSHRTQEKTSEPNGQGQNGRGAFNRFLKDLDESRKILVEQLKAVRYFHKQARWLQERFPDAVFQDVEGLVKLVSMEEIAANDYSLTPGRYVGVTPEEEDENFDFEEALRDIHIELTGLNQESQELAAIIARNFEELGV